MQNILKAFLVFIVLVFSFSSLNSYALSSDEYCTEHNDAMAGGICIKCEDDCLVIIGNLGDRICKQCSEVQCTLVDNCGEDCPSCPASEEE